MEDDAIGLGHRIGQNIQAAAMRHAVYDFADAKLPAIFDNGCKRRNNRFAAVKTEALRAYIFAAQELFILLGFDDLAQNRFLALSVK